jgi:hypothetical protein
VHSESQIGQIVASMREWGWTIPILVDGTGEIIAGHGRLAAAQRLEWTEAPVIVAHGWSEAQKRAYAISDNQLTINAKWDDAAVRADLQALSAADFDLALVGFEPGELAAFQLEPSPGPETPKAPEVLPELAPAVSRFGELWQLGEHRLLCADSILPASWARLMGEARAVLLHADPPYGMGKEAAGIANDNLRGEKADRFALKWFKAARPYLENNASVYIWGNAPELWRLWYAGGLAELEPSALRNEIVWDKKTIAGMASEDLTQYPTATERCLFIHLGALSVSGRPHRGGLLARLGGAARRARGRARQGRLVNRGRERAGQKLHGRPLVRDFPVVDDYGRALRHARQGRRRPRLHAALRPSSTPGTPSSWRSSTAKSTTRAALSLRRCARTLTTHTPPCATCGSSRAWSARSAMSTPRPSPST